MGGGCGVSVTVPVSVRALQKHTDLQLNLVGDKNLIGPFLQDEPQSLVSRLRLIHSTQRNTVGKRPQSVLRASRDSSLYLAVDLVKQGKFGAMAIAGNSGASLLIDRHLLKTLSGINKSAILATLPSVSEPCYLLDVRASLLGLQGSVVKSHGNAKAEFFTRSKGLSTGSIMEFLSSSVNGWLTFCHPIRAY